MFLGALTLIFGIIVSFHPTGSLNVLAVLLGVLMIFSGIFHLIRVFDPEENHRVWLGIAGLLFIVIGVVLIRHLHLTLAVIGLMFPRGGCRWSSTAGRRTRPKIPSTTPRWEPPQSAGRRDGDATRGSPARTDGGSNFAGTR